ncbi:CapA family protein [Akkermansiaceae bacterium]|nr:CapA family protein [Akkermansiaceae bacterium]
MKVAITGDLFLGGDLSTKSGIIRLTEFDGADLRIVNLEQAVSDRAKLEPKCTVYTGSEQLHLLKEWKVDVAALAHNHIHDKGSEGICDTLRHLDECGIAHVGVGNNAAEAECPHWLTENLALFNYCDFARKTLTNIQVADREAPGVHPLRQEQIESDLSRLKSGQQAVLFFHWGVEHLWMPPPENMALARSLLEDERVALIVGSHPHRAQGCLRVGNKRAYFCLGNFLFPNFYIEPPAQITVPESEPSKVALTRRYHAVWDLTYKKWKLANRISLLVIFDSESGTAAHEFAVQSDDEPTVSQLRGIAKLVATARFHFLSSVVYRLPEPLYRRVYRIHLRSTYFFWALGIRRFQLRQRGLRAMVRAALGRLRSKAGC